MKRCVIQFTSTPSWWLLMMIILWLDPPILTKDQWRESATLKFVSELFSQITQSPTVFHEVTFTASVWLSGPHILVASVISSKTQTGEGSYLFWQCMRQTLVFTLKFTGITNRSCFIYFSAECLEYVRNVTSQFWEIYTAGILHLIHIAIYWLSQWMAEDWFLCF